MNLGIDIGFPLRFTLHGSLPKHLRIQTEILFLASEKPIGGDRVARRGLAYECRYTGAPISVQSACVGIDERNVNIIRKHLLQAGFVEFGDGRNVWIQVEPRRCCCPHLDNL